MDFTLSVADCRGAPKNTMYPHRVHIHDADSLREAVSRDYTAAELKDCKRRNENFLGADCVIFDVDNEGTDVPEEWVTPETIEKAFPDVEFAVHYSRNHMKEKNGESARPRFHVIFPIPLMTDVDAYAALKRRAYAHFPHFDPQALDISRAFFGTTPPEVELHDGWMTLTDFLDSLPDDTPADDTASPLQPVAAPAAGRALANTLAMSVIPQGLRNSTLSLAAGQLLVKYGDTSTEARDSFDALAARCDPPLPAVELSSIWASAQRFFARIKAQPNYVPPGSSGGSQSAAGGVSYKPNLMTDVGQAEMLAKMYGDRLCYTRKMGLMSYQDGYWQASETQARAAAQDLTLRQFREAEEAIRKQLAKATPNATLMNQAQNLRDYAVSRQQTARISATITEVEPMIEVPFERFDADANLLNMPDGVVDLREGLASMRDHAPYDYMTRITEASPSKDGMQTWLDFLDVVFCHDPELIEFFQLVMGQMLFGHVYQEAMIIAYGNGSNGKSSCFNAILKVMGSYGGKISAEALTAGAKQGNRMQEMAAVRGKRLIIASEMQEGARLDDGMLKQLCSTDPIWAKLLYHEPFSFIPSHTLVLYTNHLPRVSSLDYGTWRRLIVIPFNARIQGSGEIKNYGDYLFEHAGGAILTWLIEGAAAAFAADFKFEMPAIVKQAVAAYRDQNDWISHFIGDACVTGVEDDCKVSPLDLYRAYHNYCKDRDEYTRRTNDFYLAIENAGYKRTTEHRRKYFVGIRLKTDEDDSADPAATTNEGNGESNG